MVYIYYILAGGVFFFLRQAAQPWLGQIADVFIVVPAIWLWLWREKNQTWFAFFSGSIFLDISIPSTVPLYSLTTLATLILVNLLVLPYISRTNLTGRWLTFMVWLISWRLMYVVVVFMVWLLGDDNLVFNKIIWRDYFLWFLTGLLLGWLVLGLLNLFSKRLLKLDS